MTIEDIIAAHKYGSVLGTTDWEILPQAMLTEFEVLTKSNDPLHTDPEWTKAHTEFESTIAPGFLTLSLLPYFVQQLELTPTGFHALNYGFDKIRWVAPVPVDSEVRAVFKAGEVKKRISGEPGVVVSYDVSIEVRGAEQPAMVAVWLGAILPDNAPASSETEK